MWFRKKSAGQAAPVHAPAAITAERIEKEVKSFIDSQSKLIRSADIDRNTTLFTSGLLDSLAFLKLVVRLEKTFQVKLSKSIAVTLANLDTLERITRVVQEAAEPPIRRE